MVLKKSELRGAGVLHIAATLVDPDLGCNRLPQEADRYLICSCFWGMKD